MSNPNDTQLIFTKRPLFILIVEDNDNFTFSLGELLKRLRTFEVGYIHSNTLHSAITMLSLKKFELIILDLGLPDSRGINTLEAIQRLTNTKILILTGSIMDEEVLKLYNVKGYIHKTDLNLEVLETQMKLALETDSLRIQRKKLEDANNELEKEIDKFCEHNN